MSYKYGLSIEEKEPGIWNVRDDRNGYKVGEIKYFGGFEQPCLFTLPAIMPLGYLVAVSEFISNLLTEKKKPEK